MSEDEKTADAEKENEEEDNKPKFPFCVAYDKRGQAKCKVCKNRFEKGELRFGKYGYNPFGPMPMKMWHHVNCIFESFKKARATTKKLDDVDADVEDWDTITDEDKQVVLDNLSDFQKFCSAKGISAATTPKKDAPKKVAKTHTTSGGPAKDSKDKAEIKSEKKVDPADAKFAAKDDSFRQFRRLCATVADTSSYLSKTEEVHKFFTKGTGGDKFRGDLELWVRLLLPGVIKRVYNLQSKQLVKIFSQVFSCNQEEMLEHLEEGDVAETVSQFFENSNDLQPAAKSDVTMHQVDKWLNKLATLTKEEEQTVHLSSIARSCTSNDLKMVVRLIKGDLRINAGAKHILDGVHPSAYEAFQTTRNLADVLKQVQEKQGHAGAAGGLPRELSIKARVLTPVLPMLALACKSVDQAFKKCPNGMYSEIKYDGERVQLHKTGSEFKYFSRSLKPVMDHKVSHFSEFIPQAFPHGNDLILDAEVLLVDTRTGDPLPFGTLGKHKKTEFQDAKVCLFVFDCIHYNGENLMKKPLSERRAVLLSNMIEVKHRVQFSEMQEIHKHEDLRAMIARVLSEGLEGLVLKDIKSIYEPGKRHWLKVKKDYLADGAMADSADLVVLGAWYGTGKKGGMMSVFLMGCYDPHTDKWCTVTKVHTGHDDAALEKLQKTLEMEKISGDYNRVPAWLNCSRTMTPDFVAKDPKESPVWEITGAEFTQNQIHSADGISIRFPRVTKQRHDKDWQTATDLDHLKELFKTSKEKDFGALLGVEPTAKDETDDKNGLSSNNENGDQKDEKKEENKKRKYNSSDNEEEESEANKDEGETKKKKNSRDSDDNIDNNEQQTSSNQKKKSRHSPERDSERSSHKHKKRHDSEGGHDHSSSSKRRDDSEGGHDHSSSSKRREDEKKRSSSKDDENKKHKKKSSSSRDDDERKSSNRRDDDSKNKRSKRDDESSKKIDSSSSSKRDRGKSSEDERENSDNDSEYKDMKKKEKYSDKEDAQDEDSKVLPTEDDQ
uniref:DNA ligase n=1 Tax=Hirondellea gigas TaxID=1518452 RepID=A0A2P2I0Z2_9CRUS